MTGTRSGFSAHLADLAVKRLEGLLILRQLVAFTAYGLCGKRLHCLLADLQEGLSHGVHLANRIRAGGCIQRDGQDLRVDDRYGIGQIVCRAIRAV